MPSLRGLYDETVRELKKAGIGEREAEVESGLILEFVFGIKRTRLYTDGEKELTDEKKLKEFSDLVQKRTERIPLQHLTHTQSFMGFDFYVDENVLIPRPDTEILVEEAMKELNDGMKVLDLCTGSGCILLSLMKYKNGIEGVCSDISREALRIAEKNAKRLGLFESVRFIESDLFEAFPAGEKFDAILSNPPYIRTEEITNLMPEVKEYDPLPALDGGEDGLKFYRRIVADAKEHLMLSGLLMLEIGYDQGEAVARLLSDAGYSGIRVLKDYAGHDRVVTARVPVPAR